MSEMMGADLVFKVPASWRGPDEHARHISGWNGSIPIYGGEEYTIPTLGFKINGFDDWDFQIDVVDDHLQVRWSGEINYGWTGGDDEGALLDWLREHQVPFIASTDAKYEFDGDTEYFNGFASVGATSGNEGAFLTRNDWNHYVGVAQETTPVNADVNRWIVNAVDSWFKARDPDIGNYDISHLPAEPPKEEDEECSP